MAYNKIKFIPWFLQTIYSYKIKIDIPDIKKHSFLMF